MFLLSHSSQIPLFLNPNTIAPQKVKKKIREPEPNPYLYREEDEVVGGAVLNDESESESERDGGRAEGFSFFKTKKTKNKKQN